MTSESDTLHQSPLKAPAVEVVDLTSDEIPADGADGDDEDDDQWSLYEDAIEGEGSGDETSQTGGPSIISRLLYRLCMCLSSLYCSRVSCISETSTCCWRGPVHYRDY